MEQSVVMETLDETPSLPELSFDDLVDTSPVKKNESLIMHDDIDPIAINEEDRLGTVSDDILNTPVTKKVFTAEQRTAAMAALRANTNDGGEQITKLEINVATPATANATRPITSNTTATTSPAVPLATKKIIVNKVGVPTFQKQFVKLTHQQQLTKPTTAVSTTTTSPISAITTAAIGGGRTAVKTATGQIIYIQKSTSGQLPAVRLQPGSTVVTAGTKAATTNVTSSTVVPKGVAIQMMRTADGSLVPLKTITTTTAQVANKTNSLPLSPQALAAKLSGKKILTTAGGQHVVITKSPLNNTLTTTAVKVVSAPKDKDVLVKPNASSTINATTVAVTPTTTTTINTVSKPTTPVTPVTAVASTATTSTSSPAVPTKILVKTTNGKPIVVSNQNIIKLSPKVAPNTTTTLNVKGGIPSANGGHLHAIQIPGKPGMQWVRVLPQSKLATAKPAAGNITASSQTTTSASTSATTTTPTATPTSNTTSTPTSNAGAQSVVSVSASPSVAGTNVKVLNSLPHKFTVVRPMGGTSKIILTQSPKLETGSKIVPLVRSTVDNKATTNATVSSASGSLVLKSKISDINTEIKRITGTGTGGGSGSGGGSGGYNENNSVEIIKKMDASGKRVLLMPMMRNANGQMQRLVVQSTTGGGGSESTGSQKVYSVLKSNNSLVENKAKMKSYIICGQARALMAQQQQHKSSQEQEIDMVIAQQRKQHLEQQQREEDEEEEEQAKMQPPRFIKLKPEAVEPIKLPIFEEPTGPVRRKHCNCSKSQCLKLYCDCFANGEFCKDCSCKDCCNNLEYEVERQRAIRNCLERNPSAFKPKITTPAGQSVTRLHNKGCNCKRSGCLKNYCECYEAKISCSSNCKCYGCRNVEDRPDLDMDPVDAKLMNSRNESGKGDGKSNSTAGQKRPYDSLTNSSINVKVKAENNDTAGGNVGDGICEDGEANEKRPCNIITDEVVDATIQCMISQADECDKKGLSAFQTETLVMEELGRCLKEIIDFSLHNADLSFSQEQ